MSRPLLSCMQFLFPAIIRSTLQIHPTPRVIMILFLNNTGSRITMLFHSRKHRRNFLFTLRLRVLYSQRASCSSTTTHGIFPFLVVGNSSSFRDSDIEINISQVSSKQSLTCEESSINAINQKIKKKISSYSLLMAWKSQQRREHCFSSNQLWDLSSISIFSFYISSRELTFGISLFVKRDSLFNHEKTLDRRL
jgi:hypothetical protein